MIDRAACDALTEAVRHVARTEILPRFRALSPDEIETKTGPDDLVTIADRRAEAALTARVAEILPDAEIVGEEAAEHDPTRLSALRGKGTVVVVDPVDGTWNFARGLAIFGVILAVRHGGRTVFGLIYDPVFDDWITARPGEGATLVRPASAPVRLRTGAVRPESEETGYLPLGLFPEGMRHCLAPGMASYGRVASLRCSAHEYRLMACGHADWMIAARSKPWDHLAGLLILEEAGGAWSTSDGAPYDPADTRAVLMAAGSQLSLDRLHARFGRAIAGTVASHANDR